MYAKRVTPIPLPESGHLHFSKKGYVSWSPTPGKWDNEKKRTIDERFGIGVLVDTSERTLFYPNARYAQYLKENGADDSIADDSTNPKEDAVDEKKQGNQDVSQEEASENVPLEEPGQRDTRLAFGQYYALKEAAKIIGCFSALENVFPLIADKIFALVVHSIDAQNSVSQNFSNWYFNSYCGIENPLSSGQISELYGCISESKIREFLDQYKEFYMSKFYKDDTCTVAYDVTNQNTNSNGIDFAEFGHSKVDEGLPCINTAMYVDEATGIPLYYEQYMGSLTDKVQCANTVENSDDLGFKKLFYVVDKGFFSESCLKAFSNNQFAVMCPNISFVTEILSENKDIIRNNIEYAIDDGYTFGIFVSDIEYKNNYYNGYVYYDNIRAEQEKRSIFERAFRYKNLVLERKRFSEKLKEQYKNWLIIKKIERADENERNFTVEFNSKSINDKIEMAGFFMVISNVKKDMHEILNVIRARDTSEKCFRRFKYHFDLSKTYTHKTETYIGKMFMAFLATITAQAFHWLAKDSYKTTSSQTLATTIGYLRRYIIYQHKDMTWGPAYALTAKMKRIFNSLSLTPDQVETAARHPFTE